MACGHDVWDVGPGGFVFLPRAIPHAFLVVSGHPVRALQLTTPAGFEHFVAAVGVRAAGPGLPIPTAPDVPALAAAAARFHTEIVGPPLLPDRPDEAGAR